jgi:heme/copper-type cytochrome/quinol oxidase subunit 2
MTLQTDAPHLGRTFAMTVVGAGCLATAAAVAYLIALFVPEAVDDPQGAQLLLVFAVIAVLFGGIGAASVVWSGARRRAWFWLAAAILSLLFLAMNVPYITHDIFHPAITSSYLITIVATSGGLAAIIGGVTAFLEVRRGRPRWTHSGRAGWVTVAVIGVVLGAAATSILAGLASAGGAGIAEAPTVTGVITAEHTMFVETSLHMKDGEVLGLFIINKDDIGHSFDVDSLDIHVELPPASTTAVAIKPTGPGSLEFYCDVPGHRDAGMVGTISVEP